MISITRPLTLAMQRVSEGHRGQADAVVRERPIGAARSAPRHTVRPVRPHRASSSSPPVRITPESDNRRERLQANRSHADGQVRLGRHRLSRCHQHRVRPMGARFLPSGASYWRLSLPLARGRSPRAEGSSHR